MSNKGFFSFFRNPKESLSEEDQQQRNYAMEKAREEASGNTSYEKSASVETATATLERPAEEEQPPVSEEIASFCIEKLDELLRLTQLYGHVEVVRNSNNTLILEIVNSEDLGRTIGKAGSTLDALQTLVRTFAFRKFETPFRLSVDAGEYKKKKDSTLKERVLKVEKSVLSSNQSRELEPMNSFDRRTVHMMYENHPDIQTSSIGEGSNRRVLLEPRRYND